jgi:hypothetical protein
MSVNKIKKLNTVKDLEETALLENLSVEESEQIRGGYDPPAPWFPAEIGFKSSWGKCNVDEVIGPDGQCYKYLTANVTSIRIS